MCDLLLDSHSHVPLTRGAHKAKRDGLQDTHMVFRALPNYYAEN